MIRTELIGNLTRDPETRTIVKDGEQRSVCSFTVAVNRYGREDAVFVRVSVWGKAAENCQKYLRKGRKVYVAGEPEARGLQGRDGEPKAELCVTAAVGGVEFLTPKGQEEHQEAFSQDTGAPPSDTNGYVQVDDETLP